MNPETLLLLPILIPLLFACVVFLFRRQARTAAILALVAVIVALVSFLLALGNPSAKVAWPWLGTFSLSFSLTGWKSLLLSFGFAFQLMTSVYLLNFIPRIRKPFLFLFFLLVSFAAFAGVILTDSLFFMLISWEVILVSLYAMIYSGGDEVEPVALKALIIGGAGDFLMILGLLLYFNLAPGAGFDAHLPVSASALTFASFVLLFLGAGAKAGMFPFHTWIPDAAEAMPAPGFAVLPASLEKIVGIYFLFRIVHDLFIINDAARTVMYVFAAATIFVVIFPALVEKNLKKILALTAISPVGFMVAGLATSEVVGMAGALMYMLTHAAYKSTMFLAAGNFERKTGNARLADMQGIARIMPVTAIGFLLAFTAAISLPPTGGFMAKELIFEGVLERGHFLMFALLCVGAILNIAVFCKVIAVLWADVPSAQRRDERPYGLAWPVLVLGAGAVLTGSFFTLAIDQFDQILSVASPGWILSVWHLSPLTAASFAVYLFGFLLYFMVREKSNSAAETFDQLHSSPVLGRALQMADKKTFDGYEIGLKVVHWLANLVFRYFERLIDQVMDGLIAIGQGIFRPMFSAIHNGVYGNYLGWVILGFIVVLCLIFGSAHI